MKIGNIKYLAFIILGLISLSTIVYGAQFTSYKIIADAKGNIVNEDFIITLLNDGNSSLASATISAPKDSKILSLSDSYGDLEYQTSIDRALKIKFDFTVPVEPLEERIVVIKLQTNALIVNKDGYNEYLLVFTPRQDISKFEHILKLPKDAKLFSPKEGFDVVYPPTDLMPEYTTPTLGWKMDIKKDEPTVFLVRYKTETNNFFETVTIAALVAMALGALYYGGEKIKRRYKIIKTLKSINILNEREKMVMEAVIKKEGIKQYELLHKLGYTKASLSKIVSKLESRGLIKKKKIGKINKLYPGDKI